MGAGVWIGSASPPGARPPKPMLCRRWRASPEGYPVSPDADPRASIRATSWIVEASRHQPTSSLGLARHGGDHDGRPGSRLHLGALTWRRELLRLRFQSATEVPAEFHDSRGIPKALVKKLAARTRGIPAREEPRQEDRARGRARKPSDKKPRTSKTGTRRPAGTLTSDPQAARINIRGPSDSMSTRRRHGQDWQSRKEDQA